MGVTNDQAEEDGKAAHGDGNDVLNKSVISVLRVSATLQTPPYIPVGDHIRPRGPVAFDQVARRKVEEVDGHARDLVSDKLPRITYESAVADPLWHERVLCEEEVPDAPADEEDTTNDHHCNQ